MGICERPCISFANNAKQSNTLVWYLRPADALLCQRLVKDESHKSACSLSNIVISETRKQYLSPVFCCVASFSVETLYRKTDCHRVSFHIGHCRCSPSLEVRILKLCDVSGSRHKQIRMSPAGGFEVVSYLVLFPANSYRKQEGRPEESHPVYSNN